MGAIARSDQIVVVGDPKQLPPTSFFAPLDSDDDDALDEQVDAESILDLAQAVFRPMRRLRWHYRSRHGSLVAFSNREFYDDDLIVFPSPAEAESRPGRYEHEGRWHLQGKEQYRGGGGGVRGGGRAHALPTPSQPWNRDPEPSTTRSDCFRNGPAHYDAYGC